VIQEGSSPTPTSPGQPCSATYAVDASWVRDNLAYAVFSLYLQNTGDAAVLAGYALSVTNPGYASLEATWNWKVGRL